MTSSITNLLLSALLPLSIALGPQYFAEGSDPSNLPELASVEGYYVLDLPTDETSALYLPVAVQANSLTFLLDTGSAYSLLDERISRHFFLSPPKLSDDLPELISDYGQGLEVRVLPETRVENFRLRRIGVGLTDLSEQRIPFKFNPAVGRAAQGVWGARHLARMGAWVDVGNATLYTRPRRLQGENSPLARRVREAGFEEVSLFELKGNYLVNVEINGTRGWMVVDTGAYLTVIEPEFANAGRIKPQFSRTQVSLPTGSNRQVGTLSTPEFRVGEMSISQDSVSVFPVSAAFESGDMPAFMGVLGMDVLKNTEAIIDLELRHLYLSKR
jgi:hypothetical protein